MTVEHNKVALLDGRSAYELSRLETLLFGVGGCLEVVGLATVFGGFNRWQLVSALAFAAIVTGGIFIVLYSTSVLSLARQRSEERRGYTTLPTPHRGDLKLVLPRSGIVVRDIGDHPLTEAEFRELMRKHP
jgi:hypothetical protein